jgi:hypothetical protein
VHTAFSEHRPLQLTPDIIWLTLAQGFAQHVNNNAEVLRSRFVKHQGKQMLTVVVDGLPAQPQQWAEPIQNWCLQIRDQVGADLYRLLECNFSTTTPVTRTASHVVMMDTFRQYFGLANNFQNPIVIAKNTVQLFEQIFAADGNYYFDQPNFLPHD